MRRLGLSRIFYGAAALLIAVAAFSPGLTTAQDAKDWAKSRLPELVDLYRYFHSHPELSFEEYETGAKVAQELRAAGIEVTDKFAKTGVVGVLKNGPGPTVMIRTDLDALPVSEQTGLAYASKVKVKGEAGETGVMHACGHDIHITNLIGTAGWFASHKDQWKGTVIFLG